MWLSLQVLNSGQGSGPRWLLFGTQASAVQIHNRLPKGRGKPRPRQLLSEKPCMWPAPDFRVRGFRLDAVHCLLMPSFSLSSSPLCPKPSSSLLTLCFLSFAISCHSEMSLPPALPLCVPLIILESPPFGVVVFTLWLFTLLGSRHPAPK